MSLSFNIYQPDDLRYVAGQIISHFSKSKIFTFYGDLGVGKTTFIKYILEYLNVTSIVNSPSFNIINEYLTKDKQIIYHFDFYRVKSLEEAIDIGVEEYFNLGNYCFIEWPNIVIDVIPKPNLLINMEKNAKYRKISVENLAV